MLFGKEIDLATLEALRDNDVPEQRGLDYKQQLPSDKEPDRKDFARDVAAMANAVGGTILYGITEKRTQNGEKTGLIESIDGIETAAPDSVISRLDNLCRTTIDPRIAGLRVTATKVADAKYVFIVTVPQSFNAPHMVTLAGDFRFYIRTSTGKSPMSTAEIRNSVLASGDVQSRLESWRDQRLERIAAEAGIVRVCGPRLAIHVLPLNSMLPGELLDVELVALNGDKFYPILTTQPAYRFTANGFVNILQRSNAEDASGYCHVFRRGQIEAVDTTLLGTSNDAMQITSVGTEQYILGRLILWLSGLKVLNVEAPYLVSLSFIGAKGYTIKLPELNEINISLRGGTVGLSEQLVVLPSLFLATQDDADNIQSTVRPLFNSLWNAFGLERSPNFDNNGKWNDKIFSRC